MLSRSRWHPPDPTKCIASSSVRSDLVLRKILMVGRDQPKISCVRILKIDPLFIACHNPMQERLSFCLASKIRHVFWRRSICLSFSSCGIHFLIFWIFPMACSRIEMAAWETSNYSASICCDWVSSSSKRANWQSLTFLGRFSRFLSLRSKLSSIEPAKPISARCFR